MHVRVYALCKPIDKPETEWRSRGAKRGIIPPRRGSRTNANLGRIDYNARSHSDYKFDNHFFFSSKPSMYFMTLVWGVGNQVVRSVDKTQQGRVPIG